MSTPNDPMQDEVARITDRILDSGFIIKFVPAEAAHAVHLGTSYGYTVGRTLAAKPEFLVTGVPLEFTEQVLHELVRMDDATGQMVAGAYPRIGVAGVELRMKLVEASPEPMLAALLTFGLSKVAAVQALWPRDGGYPSESDQWPDQPLLTKE